MIKFKKFKISNIKNFNFYYYKYIKKKIKNKNN